MNVTYLQPGFVKSAQRTARVDYREYGGNIRMPYTVKCADNRERRVYAMSYGNAASLYLVVGGKDVFLDIDTEYMLQAIGH